ncbi:uncharacterized protein B0T15DRAFT_115456 [Chaetomium strumarium]|uniref:Ams2/SPT21 N-terminal domain-containing protein n=1 Tax=Chaetomium strumarium TaxID=1170767 RepID=A0AAJ0GYY3_9PEZI|nr:hypothetical protein B0T15DRAFT_115456 [Chaetomium strumarium]
MTSPNNTQSKSTPHLIAGQPSGGAELSLQPWAMGLKVAYTFDPDNQVQRLARWPHTLQIQTVPLDQQTTIGLIDLRTCLQAVVESSPELLDQQNDYSVYSADYSEPNVPLVGQGRLSSALDSQREPREQMITGYVTRNLLGALLNHGCQYTLEVNLRFTAIARQVRRTDDPSTVAVDGTRSRQPTGRPRGRPRKTPRGNGDTSAAEEATDGDEGPQRKRAKVVRTEYPSIVPFGAVPGSLRVAASTSGSLRTMRPVGDGGGVSAATSHLQNVPRAPTPIPTGPLMQQHPRERVISNLARSESMANTPSPDNWYSAGGSAADLLSSPSASMRSTPPALSPELQIDSGFMSGGVEDFFDANLLHTLQQRQSQDQTLPQQQNFRFQHEIPGPPELLPSNSLFNPAGKARALNRQTATASAQSAPETSMGLTSSLPPSRHAAEGGFTGIPQRAGSPASVRSMPVPERPRPETVLPTQPASRPGSRHLHAVDVPAPAAPAPAAPASADPASEPVAHTATPVLSLPRAVTSEAPCPSSDVEAPRHSKNYIKKMSIKERLEMAVEKGEMPQFCANCGAIQTPTWRKIWSRHFQGRPEVLENEPGGLIMIEVLAKDAEGLPSAYRMVKKNLGPLDEKSQWTPSLLCNPCGIWLQKFKSHRPPDRWEKDAERLNAPRQKRGSKVNKNSRSKKTRTKNEARANPTSEAYFTTDPVGPAYEDSPKVVGGGGVRRGSGTADSPIAVEEDDLGSTRRLLFSSPRRDGAQKVFGELHPNTVQAGTNAPEVKSAAAAEESDPRQERPGTPVDDDLAHELFGTPPKPPSTPPPVASGPFKTPTRRTPPSHRPITRSISRSARSVRHIPRSPDQQQIPTELGLISPFNTELLTLLEQPESWY